MLRYHCQIAAQALQQRPTTRPSLELQITYCQ